MSNDLAVFGPRELLEGKAPLTFSVFRLRYEFSLTKPSPYSASKITKDTSLGATQEVVCRLKSKHRYF